MSACLYSVIVKGPAYFYTSTRKSHDQIYPFLKDIESLWVQHKQYIRWSQIWRLFELINTLLMNANDNVFKTFHSLNWSSFGSLEALWLVKEWVLSWGHLRLTPQCALCFSALSWVCTPDLRTVLPLVTIQTNLATSLNWSPSEIPFLHRDFIVLNLFLASVWHFTFPCSAL